MRTLATEMFFILIKSAFNNFLGTVCCCLLICPLAAHAQVSYIERFELQLRDNEPGYNVIPMGDEGLFLLRELFIADKYLLDVQLLGKDFEKKWGGYVPVDRRLRVADYDLFENTLSVLFRPRAYYETQMVIMNFNIETGLYYIYNVDNPLPIRQWGYRVKEDGALIGGYFNDRPLVYYFNYATLKSRILPGFVNEPGEINQIEVYADGTFEVITSGKFIDKSRILWIKGFDKEGTLLTNNMMRPEDKTTLIFGRTIPTADNKQIIAGVYGRRGLEFSRGIFTGVNGSNNVDDLKYYNYAELENFFNYLRSKKKDRVKERLQRKKIKGRKVRLSYRLFVQEIFEYEDQYILIGQAFYPRYKQSSTLLYGNPYGNNLVFDGFRYTHAVIIGLDKSGNLLWDNSFETSDILSYDLKEFVRTYKNEEDNKLYLLYMFNNAVRSKVIQENRVVENLMAQQIPLSSSSDIIVRNNSANQGNLEYWYDNKFVAFGTQILKNKTKEGTVYRKVFFINTLEVN